MEGLRFIAGDRKIGCAADTYLKTALRHGESPEVWFDPTDVWELRGVALTISPVHKAAVGRFHPDRGIIPR